MRLERRVDEGRLAGSSVAYQQRGAVPPAGSVLQHRQGFGMPGGEAQVAWVGRQLERSLAKPVDTLVHQLPHLVASSFQPAAAAEINITAAATHESTSARRFRLRRSSPALVIMG